MNIITGLVLGFACGINIVFGLNHFMGIAPAMSFGTAALVLVFAIASRD